MLVRIDDLTVDPEIQLAARGIQPHTVAAYFEAIGGGAEFPPVVAFDDGNVRWLADGFHRIEAHRNLGLVDIQVDIKPGTRQDAMVYAALANVMHGKPMSQAEKREAGERLIRLTSWGDRDIARRLAVTHPSVIAWRAELISSGKKLPDEQRTVTRGGSTYMMDTSNIGHSAPETEYQPPMLAFGEREILERAADIRREQRAAKLADPEPVKPLPPNKYQVFYVDPPWRYGDQFAIDGYKVSAEMHYPTLSIEQLCELKVKDLVADDAVLFLWTTSPLLEDAFYVIRAWGFEYKASFVWDKVRHNFGHYNSVRHEFLLICTRGSFLPECRELQDSVVSIERTEHSRKPAYFRDMIERLYPNARRIELFARERPVGWDVWGNEVECLSATPS